MAGFTKLAALLFLLLFCLTLPHQSHQASGSSTTTAATPNDSKEELVQSESKDGKLEIIKQIKKLNNDGSYTIGYEADDGSFKIESRDVLGNIKGTYGYLDDAGEIKRVSYSTSNSSEIITSKPETLSVVQRIPAKINKTAIYTTRRPVYSTTYSTPSTTSQKFVRLRNGLLSSSTEKPNYSEVVNMDNDAEKSTAKPSHVVYASSTPRVLLQGRPLIRSTAATPTVKSEGQLIRPEVTPRPTELPLFRRLALKHPLLAEEKQQQPNDEPEKSNILRRQLAPEKLSGFDPQQHVFTLQQSLGSDATDVYSSSVTTGTPRPLFTTTIRPRALLSTSSTPSTVVSRPTIRYPSNYQRTVLQDLETNTQEYVQESTTSTTEATAETTPTPVPIVQIPANRSPQEPLVAIKHPFQRGAILVPLSQVQGRVHPFETARDYEQQMEYDRQQPSTQKSQEQQQQRPIYVRRLPPPQFRPIPVQVDENGYIRDVQQPATPYPLPLPIAPAPKYVNNDVENDIDEISPPVSTRDFQKLLQQLIMRQSRLEKISMLTDQRRPEYFQPRYRPQQVYRPTPAPYYVQRVPQEQQQYMNEESVHQQRQRQFIRQQQLARQRDQELYNQQSYAPTRRVARLLPEPQQPQNEEYLPPDVREMLLLRMLQLAINPALPLGEDDNVAQQATTPVPQYKKAPVRNVEILGEEDEGNNKRPAMRNKRYREYEMDYYDQ